MVGLVIFLYVVFGIGLLVLTNKVFNKISNYILKNRKNNQIQKQTEKVNKILVCSRCGRSSYPYEHLCSECLARYYEIK